jgi:hypothetical protein
VGSALSIAERVPSAGRAPHAGALRLAGDGNDREHLPPEDPWRGHDREDAKNYTELLAQRPVLEALEAVEGLFPEHELQTERLSLGNGRCSHIL